MHSLIMKKTRLIICGDVSKPVAIYLPKIDRWYNYAYREHVE